MKILSLVNRKPQEVQRVQHRAFSSRIYFSCQDEFMLKDGRQRKRQTNIGIFFLFCIHLNMGLWERIQIVLKKRLSQSHQGIVVCIISLYFIYSSAWRQWALLQTSVYKHLSWAHMRELKRLIFLMTNLLKLNSAFNMNKTRALTGEALNKP